MNDASIAPRAGFATAHEASRLVAAIFGLMCMLVCIGLPLNSVAAPPQTSAPATQAATAVLPGWAVLVLKPVGADRVRPITGVVVSDQGLVVVPFDFAAPGDQIIVLDGGTDIIANGRAAKVLQQIPEAGLTVLSAPALKRRPAKLAQKPPSDGDEIRLAAFPPAEMIAQGAAPLSVVTQASTLGAQESEGERASRTVTKTALPNLTGPLLDRCGNLAGFSSADGVQSMETTKAPTYLWSPDLLRVLQRLQIEVTQEVCEASAGSSLAETKAQPETAQAELAAPGSAVDQPSASDTIPVPLPVTDQPAAGSAGRLPLLGLLALVVLAALAWAFFRKRGNSEPSPGPRVDDRAPSVDGQPARPFKGNPSPSDCILEISGRLPDGTAFADSCEVNSAAIDLVIGRSQADIKIDSEHVNREHARLSGSAEMLTISDLGSIRGTWINRVPCMKGEIMFVEAEDTIFLGDVSFQIRLSQRPAGDRGFTDG